MTAGGMNIDLNVDAEYCVHLLHTFLHLGTVLITTDRRSLHLNFDAKYLLHTFLLLGTTLTTNKGTSIDLNLDVH